MNSIQIYLITNFYSMTRIYLLILSFMILSVANTFSQKKYSYETVPNDPLGVRIYTLDNGLKVYMSQYKDEPRIQTFISVRVGSKDDPSETTGLAHYFEHMMFKGTPNFGTSDWEKEKAIISQIEAAFEDYRSLTDADERLEAYKKIDSLSYEASKYAIPNEYDKIMKSIGSTGTNAATSNDFTYYVENIPNNQLRNWAKVQADRFSQPVLRLFHTELETVYEEKNMSLTNDGRRANEALMAALFPDHPYGLQTTLGHPEHLKNPSMTSINEFYKKYYVPNNMALSMSGDFDPDEAIRIVDEYLGKLVPGELPPLPKVNNSKIEKISVSELVGLEAENVRIAYKFPGATSDEAVMADLLSLMLSNGKAGLIDLNINQKQKALWASTYFYSLNDYSTLVLLAGNKADQSLDEAKALLLEQIDLLKKGDFPDWLIESAVNNLKLRELKRAESNRGRANAMAMAYIKRQDWKDVVEYNDRLAKIKKSELIKFANDNLQDNYVVIYKKQGKPDDIPKVDKPPITPVEINRDAESAFFAEIKSSSPDNIEPLFLDYTKDINRAKSANGLDILHIPNTENSTFNLIYYFPFGSDDDLMINLAASYLEYLGTSTMSPEEIGQEFYKLACSFSVFASNDQTYISLSGLSENQEKAVLLLENLLHDCQKNEVALENLKADMMKSRTDAKANQIANFRALVNYATYGSDSPSTHVLSDEELKNLKADDLIAVLRNMTSYPHEVIYYGPLTVGGVKALVEENHKVPATFKAAPKGKNFLPLDTKDNKVYFAHYDGPQSYLQTVSKGIDYSEDLLPLINMYNSYFGGGMNAIVFQEMREKRGLAYSARANYTLPSTPDKPFTNNSFIATQNDKGVDAFDAFNELFDEIPVSENAFKLAKESMITDMATNRTTKMNIIWNYISARKMGRDYDLRTKLYQEIPVMTIDQIINFNTSYISKQPKSYVILGDENAIDFETIEKKYGKVVRLEKEDYFGY